MNFSDAHDIGAQLVSAGEVAFDAETIVAAAGNDNQPISGNVIDRLVTGRSLALSCKLAVPFTTTLTQSATLSLALKLQHDTVVGMGTAASLKATRATLRKADGTSTALTLNGSGELASTVIATGGSGGSTERGVVEMDVDLGPANEFLRPVRTLDLSAGSVDTVAAGGNLVLGGPNVIPSA